MGCVDDLFLEAHTHEAGKHLDCGVYTNIHLQFLRGVGRDLDIFLVPIAHMYLAKSSLVILLVLFIFIHPLGSIDLNRRRLINTHI